MQSVVVEGCLAMEQHSLMHTEGRSAVCKRAVGNSSRLVLDVDGIWPFTGMLLMLLKMHRANTVGKLNIPFPRGCLSVGREVLHLNQYCHET